MVAPRSRPDAPWVSVNEAAAVVGRSRRTIYKWISDGLLRTRRVAGGPLQVEVDSLFQDEPGDAAPVVPAESLERTSEIVIAALPVDDSKGTSGAVLDETAEWDQDAVEAAMVDEPDVDVE